MAWTVADDEVLRAHMVTALQYNSDAEVGELGNLLFGNRSPWRTKEEKKRCKAHFVELGQRSTTGTRAGGIFEWFAANTDLFAVTNRHGQRWAPGVSTHTNGRWVVNVALDDADGGAAAAAAPSKSAVAAPAAAAAAPAGAHVGVSPPTAGVAATGGGSNDDDAPLPAPWEQAWSARQQRPYYFNRFTSLSVWERPSPPAPDFDGGKAAVAAPQSTVPWAEPEPSDAGPLNLASWKTFPCQCGSGVAFNKCCGKRFMDKCSCRSGKIGKNCCFKSSKANFSAMKSEQKILLKGPAGVRRATALRAQGRPAQPVSHGASHTAAAPSSSIAVEDAGGPEVTLAWQIASELSDGDADTDDGGTVAGGLDNASPAFADLSATYFRPDTEMRQGAMSRTTIYGDGHRPPAGVEVGLIGHEVPDDGQQPAGAAVSAEPSALHLNVTDPFCLITVGIQGSGKSHTLNCVLESCLLQCPPVSGVRRPMAALVCHYDQSDANICEATGLGQPSRRIAELLEQAGEPEAAPSVPRERLLVLCSPTFYKQRREFYDGVCEVQPLLFNWGRLKAAQIKMLMNLDESSTQLYVAVMLDMLRGFQRQAKVPAFPDFVREFEGMCSGTQSGPLKQRFQLLSSFVSESAINEPLQGVGTDLRDVLAPGRLVIVDLTDPMMSPTEANGVFQVLLETFRAKQLDGCGKVVAFDEAHRYMGLKGEGDGLAREITDCARLMRHEGLRLLISTQSPKAMPEELLELSSVLVAHRFQSADWHAYLSRKVPLPEDSFTTIRGLEPGEALVYSARPCLRRRYDSFYGFEVVPDVIRVKVRKRLTADRGSSRRNRGPRRSGAAGPDAVPSLAEGLV